MSNVVLFGAGASFGSNGIAPKVPPLGKDLFAVLSRLYPATWGQIPQKLAGTFREDFETGMQIVIQKHGFAVANLMQDMAKFFSIFTVADKSLNQYVQLLTALKEANALSQTIFATLNYECVFESAASKCGLVSNYFAPEPASDGQVVIWELHGSCNFKLTGLEATRGVQYSQVRFDGGIEPLQLDAVRSYYSGTTALYPAMALYAQGKPVSIAPTPISKLQTMWGERVTASDKIAVIGVNPNVEDSHIWTPLAEATGELAYVGDHGAFNEWKENVKEGPADYFGEKWDDTCEDIISFLC